MIMLLVELEWWFVMLVLLRDAPFKSDISYISIWVIISNNIALEH